MSYIDDDVIQNKGQIVRSFLFTVLVLIACIALASVEGCAPFKGASSPDRASARATILTIAEATKKADSACGSYALAAKDVDVAKRCADAYDVARNAILSASYGVDAWDSAEQGRIACAAVDAVRALAQITETLESVHVAIPPAAADAVSLAKSIGRVCHG
jgi:hypothetical protein